jgi:hypothetical protein
MLLSRKVFFFVLAKLVVLGAERCLIFLFRTPYSARQTKRQAKTFAPPHFARCPPFPERRLRRPIPHFTPVCSSVTRHSTFDILASFLSGRWKSGLIRRRFRGGDDPPEPALRRYHLPHEQPCPVPEHHLVRSDPLL